MKASNSLRDGLVGAWAPSVSGWGGTILRDLSGRGNHGTLTNMDPATDWVTSGGYGALDFDGSNDFVRTESTNIFIPTFFSVCCWLRLTNNSNQLFIGHGAVNTSFELFIEGNTLRFRSSAGGAGSIVGPTPILNELFFVAGVVLTTSTSILYYNTTPTTGSAIRADAKADFIRLGYFPFGYYFNGQIADARIYNRALSPQEIRTLYDGGPGYGLRPQRTRRYHAASSFSPSWVRRQSLIGSGVY